MNWKKNNTGSVPQQEVLFQVELSLDAALGEISAGLFVFEQGVTLKASKKDWKKNKKEYQERANKLMTRHYEFYQSICDEEYVTSGSVLSCSNSEELITIELPEDHGIIAENGKPLLTCKDCEAGTHIGSFGTCSCNPENYTRLGHHPSELSDEETVDGRGKYKCFPILSHDWITKNQDFMIYVGNIEADFHAALEKGAVLVCQYGGLITIEEVPDKTDDELQNEPIVPEEPEDDFYDHFYYDWMKEGMNSSPYVTPDFLKKVDEISEELGINPDDLMAVMAFESWLIPTCGVNKEDIEDMKDTEKINNAVGLTQFTQIRIDDINEKNGTNYTKAQIVKMNAIDQLDVVYLMFKPYKDKMNGLSDVYMAVLAPACVGKDDNAVVYSQEKSPKNYKENAGLDKDKKGYITVGDAVAAVLDRRANYE